MMHVLSFSLRAGSLPAALLATVCAMPAAAQSAPDANDYCLSDRNGVNSALPVARSCAAVTANGTGGGRAAIGNGRADPGAVSGGGGGGSVSWANDGWTNSAQATSGNGGIGQTSSDLTTGRLRASASTYVQPNDGAQVFTLARMGDVITFVNNSGADQTVTLGYTMDGQFLDAGGSNGNYGYVHLSFGSLSLRLATSGGSINGLNMTTDFWTDGYYNQSWYGGTEDDFTFSRFGSPAGDLFGGSAFVSFIIPEGESSLAFGFTLNISCRIPNSACDFGNTSALTLAPLPVGVSFTSQSGVLFSGLEAGAVPEPESWAMMILGFGVVGGLMRSRRASVHPGPIEAL